MHKELLMIIFELSSRENITSAEAETLEELREQSGDLIECLNAQGTLSPWIEQILIWGAEYQEDKELVRLGERMLEELHEQRSQK
jgi:hypothetical protein